MSTDLRLTVLRLFTIKPPYFVRALYAYVYTTKLSTTNRLVVITCYKILINLCSINKFCNKSTEINRNLWPIKYKPSCNEWYVPSYIWPARSWGFSFVCGCATWYTIDAVRTLLTASLCLNVLYLEDAYLTGHLRSRLGIPLYHTFKVAHDLRHSVLPDEAEHFQVVCHQNSSALREFWKQQLSTPKFIKFKTPDLAPMFRSFKNNQTLNVQNYNKSFNQTKLIQNGSKDIQTYQ